MRGMKDAGLDELQRLKRRAIRQRALGRIGVVDAEYIVKHLDLVETRIVEMQEDDPAGREF